MFSSPIPSCRRGKLAETEAELTALAGRPNAGLLDLRFVFWDEELKQVVTPMEKNLRLMAVLYPAAIALSALIAAGLAALLLAQSAREAAILRALGARKRAVRAAFVFERIAVTLAGLALGLAALALLRGSAGASLSGDSLLCAGAYLAGTLLGAALAAIPAANRPPLSLLQVRE